MTGEAPVAAIDVGAETTRLLVARAIAGRVEPLATGSAPSALGAGSAPGGRIGDEGLDMVAMTVRQMAEEARRLGARRLVVACTAPGRTAGNAEALMERLATASGVTPRLLSGPEEAALAFRGMVAAGAPDPLVAVHVGGAGLDLMGGEGGALRWATSVPLGARALTERFAPPDPPGLDLLEPMVSATRELLDAVAVPVRGAEALAGGTPVDTLARLAESDDLDRADLLRAVERLAATPASDLAEEIGVDVRRVRAGMAGAALLEAVRRSFGLENLRVSRAGLREGLVLEAAA